VAVRTSTQVPGEDGRRPKVEEVGEMETTRTTAGPYPALIDWLQHHDVGYELREHPLAFTATEAAHADGVEPATFAKVVGVHTSDGRDAIALLDATDQVDLGELAGVMGVKWVALLGEAAFGALAPGCDVGTAPPIPDLVGVPVYVDEAVRADPKISFHAGSHRYAVRVAREAWERAAGVTYGRFGVHRRSTRAYMERGLT
jgi:prolyl-tRNA editing enzyme YbaK/EbsC (Cys-tRNA(Pro) deacylase)